MMALSVATSIVKDLGPGWDVWDDGRAVYNSGQLKVEQSKPGNPEGGYLATLYNENGRLLATQGASPMEALVNLGEKCRKVAGVHRESAEEEMLEASRFGDLANLIVKITEN